MSDQEQEQPTTFLVDDFVHTRIGEPYRLFPFGELVKNGRRREITPEMAAKFRLPHFKPAIKLGSHDEPTPAGGHIVALEVRQDGLYCYPEWNDKGAGAINDGAYRYHSPEVIWDDGALEDPATGELIEGPMIVGDALLHMPHLGEAAALYSVAPIQQKENKDMTEETVNVPKSFWEKFTALFERLEAPAEVEEEVIPAVSTDEYDAVVQERDDFKAKWEAHEAQQARAELVAKFESELAETKADKALADVLADLPEEKAALILQQLKALSAQAEAAPLEEEIGSNAELIDDPAAVFNAAVMAIQNEKKIGYAAALELAKTEHKDLFDAYVKAKE